MNPLPKTNFLMAHCSFATGAASAFNLAGNFYAFPTSPSPEEADRLALTTDFTMIANDMRTAIALVKDAESKQMNLAFHE